MNDPLAQPPTSEPDDELLVAFLDGELDAEASGAVERRLVEEPSLRERLRAISGTWELLDYLPRSTVDDSFATTTVAMVAMKAEQRIESRRQRSGRSMWPFGMAVLLAAVAFGYQWGRVIWPGPNERLLRDLPVVERFGLYRQIDDLEFIRELRARRLFTSDPAATNDRNQQGGTDDGA